LRAQDLSIGCFCARSNTTHTMNTTRMTMYWTTGESAIAIDFLDTLREAS
jgi:hypothetical protein